MAESNCAEVTTKEMRDALAVAAARSPFEAVEAAVGKGPTSVGLKQFKSASYLSTL